MQKIDSKNWKEIVEIQWKLTENPTKMRKITKNQKFSKNLMELCKNVDLKKFLQYLPIREIFRIIPDFF